MWGRLLADLFDFKSLATLSSHDIEGIPLETRQHLLDAGVLVIVGASGATWCSACPTIHEVQVYGVGDPGVYEAECDLGGGRYRIAEDAAHAYQINRAAFLRALQQAVGAPSPAQEQISDHLWTFAPAAVGKADWTLFVARGVTGRDGWLRVEAALRAQGAKLRRGVVLMNSAPPDGVSHIGMIPIAPLSEAIGLSPEAGLTVDLDLLLRLAGVAGGAKPGRRGAHPELNRHIDQALATVAPGATHAAVARAAIAAWQTEHPRLTPPNPKTVAKRVARHRKQRTG